MKKVKVGLSLSAATISGIIVVVVILILSLVFFKSIWNKTGSSANANVPTSTTSTTAPTKATTPRKTTPKTVKDIPATGNAVLVDEFSGYLFLFTENCTKVSPTSFTMKKGTKFVIRNGEDKAHTFMFDEQKYTIKPYEYAVVSTPNVGPQTIFCDDVQRASVNVQN